MARQKQWADTAAAIIADRTIDITGPSGHRFTIRPVHFDELAVEEALPADLLTAAIFEEADLTLPQMTNLVREGKNDEAQQLAQARLSLRDRIVRRALVAPEPTDKLLEALDPFDRAMICEIAQRKRSEDATGKVVAAQSLGDFEQFREVGDGAADSTPDRAERMEAVVS